ncbi:MAG: response regulator transcription factor [SAR324 cluster bacterium]|nr:response regulator transcription factor [SAR324 cluster bacterium]
MRILLVEDDQQLASYIIKGLKQAGFSVTHAADGEDGLELALVEHFDAAIMDLMLPRRDGLNVIHHLRENRIDLPVMILSAKRQVSDRVIGLQSGGDDYLVKPFSFEELLARVQALLRRSSNVTEPTSLEYADLKMDLLSRKVNRQNVTLELLPKEFALLEYLLRHAERVISKTMLLEAVWGYDFDYNTNVIDVVIHRLRKKVDHDFEIKLIHTLKGIGYVLKVD